MEDILNIIVSRRSIKKYKQKAVEDCLIEKVLKAGCYAPSGKNKQSAILLCIKNKQIRDELSALCAKYRGIENFDVFYGAPVVVAVLADKSVPTYVYDGSVVIENMLLEAHSLGLGACWIHHAKQVFETQQGKHILQLANIEGDYEGIGFCILGYADMEIKNQIPRKQNYIYTID